MYITMRSFERSEKGLNFNMYNLFFYLVLFLFSIFVFLKTLSYAKYEKDTQNNKSGAIAIVIFSALSIILSNFFVLINK